MYNIDTVALIGFVTVLIFLSLFFNYKDFYKIDLSRKGVAICGVAWVGFITLEYWVAGPFSYIYLGDEGIQSFPYFTHLGERPFGERFNPGILNGVDAYSIFSSGYQFLSIERLIFSMLTAWIALAFHKVFASFLAFFGTYLLARAAAPTSRILAVAIAAAYTLIFQYTLLVTLVHSFGYHLIPLALYVLCYRLDSRYYALISFVMAVAIAVTVMPIQGGMPFYPALIITAVASGAWRHQKFYFALGGTIFLHILNWADTLYALATFAQFTSRVQEFDRHLSLARFVKKFQVPQLLVPFIAFTLAFLVTRGQPKIRVFALFASPLLLSVALDLIPWKTLGLDFLSGLNYGYLWYSLCSLSVVAMAMMAGEARNGAFKVAGSPLSSRQFQGLAFSALLALGPATAAHYKITNGLYWLGLGGQANLADVPNLREPTWMPDERVRVAAIPQHFWDSNILPYGFDTMGGYLVLFSARVVEFWKQAGMVTVSGATMLKPPPRSCPGVRQAEEVGDMGLLRTANVRFVVSTLPIEGTEVTHVSGPSPAEFLPSCEIPTTEKLTGYFFDRFYPPEIHVYDLGEVNPRVYFARTVTNTDFTFNSEEYWDLVRSIGPQRGAVIETKQSLSMAQLQSKAKVMSWRQVPDGFDIAVAAPQGGVLVINSTFLPFWNASAEGEVLEIYPTNGTQMAVILPPGVKNVTFAYDRRLPSDFIRAFLN